MAVITPVNGKQKPLGATMGTGVLVDAAAHLQVCSAFSSHSPFRDHGKTATKIPKSTAAVYHRRTKEITPDEMYQINKALINSLDLNGGR